jgi:aminoglycoside phosphotransferase (APT) family kinase protein
MIREGRLLERIAPFYPPAPRPVLLCEDANVIGAPFYLMERRRGVVARNAAPPEFAHRDDFPKRASEAFVDALAELHSVDIRRCGLESLGKPEGFLERQVRGWSGRWERVETEPLPAMEAVSRRLLERLPKSQPATLVHNDFKLDNAMFDAADPGRVVAVFDWEMSSVGDPLVDLGVMLCYWPEAADPPARRDSICPLTAEHGWPTRAELLDRYRRKTGRDLAGIAYYETFGLFKLAVVLQQIYYRFHVGQTSDERFRCFDARVRSLAESALVRSEEIA